MDKLLRTTYRKLYRMSSRVDQNIPTRSVLSCSPQCMYDQRACEWVPLDVAKLSSWPESRTFLDNLIRRLNGGKQYYYPPTHTEGTGQTTYASSAASAVAQHDGQPSSPAASSDSGSGSASPATQIPSELAPFTPLCKTLRFFFDTTPFSMNHVNIAFAAVKELSYVCALVEKSQSKVVRLSEEEISAMRANPLPFTRAESVDAFHDVNVIKGLTEELRKAFGMSRTFGMRTGRKGAAAAAVEEEGEATTTATADDDDATTTAARNEEAAAPENVQLLLSHPQLTGFFRHCVMVVVRHADNESAALILNKPLENEEGLRMSVNATLRLDRVHPIFTKFLGEHTVMIGGPVMVGFDGCECLVHRVAGIPRAAPLADGLFLDGDMDVLLEALEKGDADPKDIIVVCGFAGWSLNQLKGEVDGGMWLIASAPLDDKRVGAFIFDTACASGAHDADPASACAPPVADPTSPATAEEDEEDEEKELPSVTLRRAKSDVRTTRAWLRAYQAMGEPLASLAGNQKPASETDEHED